MQIMNKRTLIRTTDEGKKVVLTVQGNGNIVDVKNKANELVMSTIPGYEGTVLQKKIFNAKAVSQLAMNDPRNKELLKEGKAAEKAGDTKTADEKFTAYLNAVQVSFGVLLPSATADAITNGCEIAANIQKVTTENGSLLTIDASTIAIKEPERLGKVNFSFDDEDEKAPATTEEVAAPVEETVKA